MNPETAADSHEAPRHPYAWLTYLIVAMTVFAVGVRVVVLSYVETRLVATTGDTLNLMAAETADKLDGLLTARRDDIRMMAKVVSSRVRDSRNLQADLNQLYESGNRFLWLGVLDRTGRIVVATDPASVGIHMAASPGFVSVRDAGGIHVGDVLVDEVTAGTEAVEFTAPLLGDGGTFLGALSGRIGVPALEEIALRTIKTFNAGESLLGDVEYQFLNDDGRVFVDSDLAHKGNVNLKRLGLTSMWLSEAMPSGYIEEEHLRRQVPVITGFARVVSLYESSMLKWTVLVRLDRASVIAPIRQGLVIIAVIGAAVFLPLLGLLLWSTRRLQKDYMREQQDSTRARSSELALAEKEAQARTIAHELDAALAEARTATEAKSVFLASMSHEIRTPMNAVIGMTGFLQETELTVEQREYAEAIRSSGEALLTIINDILDFSKMEAGKVRLETLDFDLRTTVEDVLDMVRESAEKKALELGCLLHAEVTTAVRGDPGRIRQILINLVGNAVKFTKRGEVIVTVSSLGRTNEAVRLKIAVTDTGIGLTPEACARLFQPFSQADSSTTREFGGTGLGLAICKQLVELMHGEIGVESVSGQGSTFWFTLQLAPQPVSAQQVKRTPVALSGRRVCLVDDNQTNRTILDAHCRQWSMETAMVNDGPGALACLRAAAVSGTPFDLAVLDMQMPSMDGLQLARAIKDDRLIAGTKLVLLTSSGLRGDAEKARQSGLAAYLVKPVRQALLQDCLTNVLSRPVSQPGSSEPKAAEPAPIITQHSLKETRSALRAHVLVAEDNLSNQKVVVRMLEKLGYKADVVCNGREAVEAVGRFSYAAVLMDCQMPEMDGLEATREIRRREAAGSGTARRMPIIALTANAMQSDRERCLQAGMDDFVTKPIRREVLAAALEQRIVSQPEPAGSGAHQEVQMNGTSVDPDCVDATVIAELRDLGDKEELLFPLISHYLDETPKLLTSMRAALDNGDAATLTRVAHNLKGTSGNLGARRMCQVSNELQVIGKTGDLASAPLLLRRLEVEFESVRHRLVVEQAA